MPPTRAFNGPEAFSRLLLANTGISLALGGLSPCHHSSLRAQPWLGVPDLSGIDHGAREQVRRFFEGTVAQLLFMRHVLLAKPVMDGYPPSSLELTDAAIRHQPSSWDPKSAPILVLKAVREDEDDPGMPFRVLAHLAVDTRPPEPLARHWARSFSAEDAILLAILDEPDGVNALLADLDPSHHETFHAHHALALTHFLEDLVGARDRVNPHLPGWNQVLSALKQDADDPFLVVAELARRGYSSDPTEMGHWARHSRYFLELPYNGRDPVEDFGHAPEHFLAEPVEDQLPLPSDLDRHLIWCAINAANRNRTCR